MPRTIPKDYTKPSIFVLYGMCSGHGGNVQSCVSSQPAAGLDIIAVRQLPRIIGGCAVKL